MLVLSRKEGQTVYVGDNIVVKVLKISRAGTVILAFEAPRDIPIVREEIRGREKKAKDRDYEE